MVTSIDPDEFRHRKPAGVMLAGDWHGNAVWAVNMIQSAACQGVDLMLHLGDFGFWPGPSGKRYVNKVDQACANQGVDLWVTLGNHEDWPRFRAAWDNTPNHHENQDPKGRELPIPISDHITVLPRGWRFTLTSPNGVDVSFVSFGGAPSIDYPWRTKGRDWWPEEMIQPEHVAAVAADGYADVMLVHDAPDIPYATAKVAHILTHPTGWTPEGLEWARIGRERITEAFLAVKPRLLAHGHFHVHDETTVQIQDVGHPTRVLSLNCDQAAGNLHRLNLDAVTGHQP